MKVHLARHEQNRWGGHTTGSWCRRTNARCVDGMNLTDDKAKVTCKFCLELMKPRRLKQRSGGSGLEQSPSGFGDGQGDSELTPAGSRGGRAPAIR